MLTRSLTALTLTALPGAAFAVPLPSGSECASDSDCTEGFVCEVTGGSACACEAGTDCDCGTPVEYRSCVPGPCQSDADCDAGMVCASYEIPCATTSPCTPDGYCPEPEPCEAASASVCAPRWVLPCETASDCGDGFACEPSQMCTCSGGAPTEPSDAGDPPPPPDGGSGSSDGSSGSGSSDGSEGGAPYAPPDCTCEPSGENYCVALQVECEDASACPSGWTCERMSAPTTDCTAPEPSGGDAGGDSGSTPPSEGSGDVPPPSDGEEKVPCGSEPTEPAPSIGMCVPPYGSSFDSGVPRADDSAGAPQYESGTAVPTAPEANDEALPGTTHNDPGCQGSGPALPVAGLALLMAALWRRRATS